MYIAIFISENASVYPGEMATFTCEVNTQGIDLVTFQWVRIDGADVTYFNESLDIEMSGFGSGGSTAYNFNSTFNVVNVSYVDDAVGFYCNASGCNVSMIAYLTGNCASIKILHYCNDVIATC